VAYPLKNTALKTAAVVMDFKYFICLSPLILQRR
jgi:hypothetical protein